MRHIVKAAYKDALHHLRKDMAKRIAGHPEMAPGEDEVEGSAAEEAGESPEEEASEDTPGMKMGDMTDEEKKESMYRRRASPPPRKGVAIVIAAGKKPGMSFGGKKK